MFALYRRFCEENGKDAVNQSLFGAAMKDRYYKRKSGTVRYENVGVYSHHAGLVEGLNIHVRDEADNDDSDSIFSYIGELSYMLQREPYMFYSYSQFVHPADLEDLIGIYDDFDPTVEDVSLYDPAFGDQCIIVSELQDEYAKSHNSEQSCVPVEDLIL